MCWARLAASRATFGTASLCFCSFSTIVLSRISGNGGVRSGDWLRRIANRALHAKTSSVWLTSSWIRQSWAMASVRDDAKWAAPPTQILPLCGGARYGACSKGSATASISSAPPLWSGCMTKASRSSS